jgi:hypothetical protein
MQRDRSSLRRLGWPYRQDFVRQQCEVENYNLLPAESWLQELLLLA